MHWNDLRETRTGSIDAAKAAEKGVAAGEDARGLVSGARLAVAEGVDHGGRNHHRVAHGIALAIG